MDEKELGGSEVFEEEDVEQTGDRDDKCAREGCGHGFHTHSQINGSCLLIGCYCKSFIPKIRPEDETRRDGGVSMTKPITIQEAASRAMALVAQAAANATALRANTETTQLNKEAEEAMKTFTSGAKRSKKMPRYDLIPKEALECLADRLELGAGKYGEWNWQKSLIEPIDMEFLKDGLNHMQHHLSSLMAGDFSEDDDWGHLGAIMFGCMMRAVLVKRLGNKGEQK